MATLKRTPLNEWHHQNGGKMVDFSGWEMPIQYEGIIKEHKRTRSSVSVFDVSHMGELLLEGKDALATVQRISCNDAGKMSIGQVQYSALLYENGTFVDDITIYKKGPETYMLCINASNIDKDFAWVQDHLIGDTVLTNLSSETGQIALQGRKATAILQQMVGVSLSELKYYWFAEDLWEGEKIMIAKMGYTGEDGYEVFCPANRTRSIWEKMMELGKEHDIAPAGLGARDTLRLEVCFPLYGNDIDDSHLALEAGLNRFIALDKEDFIGKQALLAEKEKGLSRKLIRFVLNEKGVPRHGYPIFDQAGSAAIGEVTSGSISPILNQGVGMGYVTMENAKVGTSIMIKIRGKLVPATVHKGAFVKIAKN